MRISKVPEERFNTISHFIGGILSLVGTLFLIIRADGDRLNIIICIIYGLSNAFLFFSSTICHSHKLNEDHKTVWTILDQIAIYLMIAGTYTPITVLYLTDKTLLGILLGQWIFAAIGITLSLIKIDYPRWITALIYVIQGLMLIPVGNILIDAISAFHFGLIIAGGIFYIVGSTFYVTKKPKLKPGVFGAHELWHLFVMLGATCFYILIFQSL